MASHIEQFQAICAKIYRIKMQTENHYGQRSNWIRAAILGANDGILSTASIIIGVAAATTTKEPIILAGVAGLFAGAFSMAAGEYVSVSSQKDIETADLEREKRELEETPDEELKELAVIYEERGLSKQLAFQVAQELTAHNALEAHARDELGINETMQARPLQAALFSGASFIFGGILPILVTLIINAEQIEYIQYISTIVFLIILGSVAARAGGSNAMKAIVRITLWGTIAMVMSGLIGYLFGVAVT